MPIFYFMTNTTLKPGIKIQPVWFESHQSAIVFYNES